MSLLCGIYERRAPIAGPLDAMLAALPGRGSATTRSCVSVRMAGRELSLEPNGQPPPSSQRVLPGLAIAADVRLDNRLEVRDALGLATCPEPPSDSELVVRAYKRWGVRCPTHLVGDYAFAIWDGRARQLFCARDAVGARPFYYAVSPDRFAFASDAEAVLAAPGVADDLDDAYVAAFLLRRMPSGARTFFRALRTLPPGHTLIVNASDVCVERWWRPEDVPPVRGGSDCDHAATLVDLLHRAVRDRLHDARLPGVHLSGGLDSSAIATFAARQQRRIGRSMHAFCWHPPPPAEPTEAEAAEYGLVQAVSAQEHIEPVYHAPSVRHTLAFLRRDGAHMPDRDGTALHESLVQRSAAERGVDVLLSGWGGDECASFNGRGYDADLLRSGRFADVIRSARNRTKRPIRHVLTQAVMPQLPVVRQEARNLRQPFRRRTTFVHPAFARQGSELAAPCHAVGVRSTQLALLGGGHLARRIEDWAASGARHGVEYRYPLLDRRLLEFVLGVPPDQFRRGRWNRWLMRHALRDTLPPEVCWNTSKRDPARLAPALAALAEALPTICGHLSANGDTPSRAKYLDMPSVLAHLDADNPTAMSKPGKLQAALQILDW